MSDQAPEHSNTDGGSKRSKLLVGILALLLAALAYDYLVARAGVDSAYEQIAQRSMEVNANRTEILTNLDVQELLDGEPSRTFQDSNGDRVEVYSWRSGLPIRTHDLFVVFKPSDGKQMFYRHAKYQYETDLDVSPHGAGRVVKQDGSEGMSEEEYEQASYGGGTGGDSGAGGPDRGPRAGPGGGFDPEAMFKQRDADGDGLLKNDEVPGRARENMEAIDTDADSAISKQEWMAFMQARREQSGGDRPRRANDRPEMEVDEEATSTEPADEEPNPDTPGAGEPPADEPGSSEPK